jgi:hypothetical protein
VLKRIQAAEWALELVCRMVEQHPDGHTAEEVAELRRALAETAHLADDFSHQV